MTVYPKKDRFDRHQSGGGSPPDTEENSTTVQDNITETNDDTSDEVNEVYANTPSISEPIVPASERTDSIAPTPQDQSINTDNYTGRYIRIKPSLNDGDGFMYLSQVMVYNLLGINIALGKPTYATSTLEGSSPPSSVVDGTTELLNSTKIWHSASSNRNYEFLEIDLGSSQPISSIRILGRGDCGNDIGCNERMLNLRVEINNHTTDEARDVYKNAVSAVPYEEVPAVPYTGVTNNSSYHNINRVPPKPQNRFNISTSKYSSNDIKLINANNFISLNTRDPSLPAGYTKLWDANTREYKYKDNYSTQLTEHPLLPSKRNNTSRVKRPSEKSNTFSPLPADVQILSDKTITTPWLKYFDTNIRKYFYYNTSTNEERWEHPYPPRYPVDGEIKYGDSGIPSDWEKYLDESTETYFYYNIKTTEVTWDHPNPPPYPDELTVIPNNNIPSIYNMYRDPGTGNIFYYNTETTETFWIIPGATDVYKNNTKKNNGASRASEAQVSSNNSQI